MQIHFVLIAEGSSDEALVDHIEKLCISLGASEVTGTAPDFGRLPQPVAGTVLAKLEVAVQLEPKADLFIVHRDADSPDSGPRHLEIRTAAEEAGLIEGWVALVPVQETEAWLLLDESAIRAVAGNPRGRASLDLPRPGQVEAVRDPKTRLEEALVKASGLVGRRHRKFRAKFSQQRRALLMRLPVGGPLTQLSAWIRFRSDLENALEELVTQRD